MIGKRCELPPPGWYCTREKGHDGPCAAHPSPSIETFAVLRTTRRKLLRRSKAYFFAAASFVAMAFVEMAPQLCKIFPASKWLPAVAAAVGLFILGVQKRHDARDVHDISGAAPARKDEEKS